MLKVLRGTTGTVLVEGLADMLAHPPEDPFAPEQVVVHTRGIERWLSQQLAGRLGAGPSGDGISANVAYPSPAEVITQVMGAAGVDLQALRAWTPRPLAWRLLSLVEHGLPDGLAALEARVDAAGDRRLLALSAVADHLHRYALHRPDVVLAWLDGDDRDGIGGSLATEDRWQPALLRLLADRIGTPTYAQAVVDAVAALRDGAPLPDRLGRVVLFGFTALPASHLAVLAALAERVDVTLMVLHPSPEAWTVSDGVAGQRDGRGIPIMPPRGVALPPVGSRLLQAWGRDVRELQALVQTVVPAGSVVPVLEARRETSPSAEQTVLHRLQAAVRRDRDTAAAARLPADGSVTMHACHGRARQVQVLRDEILRAMEEDPTLRPRDILVMCPDVEAFAPLVAAHLAGGGPDRPDLRVRLADRSLRQTNPLLRLLDDLLDLAATRVTAGRLVDLLGSQPVRRRFGLDDDDLESIARWTDDVGIRWGLDAEDRARFRLAGLRANTVDEGLDRLLLGAAMADEDDRSVGGITPFDDVEGGAVRLAGRLAEASARLATVLEELRRPRPVDGWQEVLGRAVDLLGLPPWDDPSSRAEVTEVLAELVAVGGQQGGPGGGPGGGAGGAGPVVGLAEVRDVLADRLQGAPSRANHMTGDLTVCTLAPMRSVPHRMVCLLGMDDDAFPRRPRPHVDDLLARSPRIGDADPRTEDRQLLLDAVMATGERLVVTWTGSDERTGEPIPPCVPIAELRRTIDALEPAPEQDDQLSTRLTTTHPLYAHDPAAFRAPAPSFDALAHRAALASTSDVPAEVRYPMPTPLRATPPTEVALDELHAAMVDPARHFVRRALRTWVPDEPEVSEDGVPIDVDGLTAWSVGEALIAAGAAGDAEATARVIDACRGRGQLPPAPLGAEKLAEVADFAERLATAAAADGIDPADRSRRRDVAVELDGRTVHGTLTGVLDAQIGAVSYSRITPKRIMTAWLSLLLATAADPEVPWQATMVGRAGSGRRAGVVRACLPALAETREDRLRVARTALADVLALHDDALAEPLIAPADTAHAYARARVLTRLPAEEADGEAASCWDPSPMGWTTDCGRPHHLLLLGDRCPYERLTEAPARPDDQRPGQGPEPHRLGGLAMRIWAPPLARLQERR